MRVLCNCGSHLFYLHIPPKSVPEHNKIVYLICQECRKVWKVKLGTLPEVDQDTGFLKPSSEKPTEEGVFA